MGLTMLKHMSNLIKEDYIMNKNDVIGKRCSLTDLLQNFPDQYAVLSDVYWDGADVGSGVVVDIIPADDYSTHQDANVKEHYYYEWLGKDEFGGHNEVCGYTIYVE